MRRIRFYFVLILLLFLTLPPQGKAAETIFNQNASDIISWLLLAAFFITFFYLLITWYKYGRDPQKGPVTMQIVPPKELSAAQSFYLYKQWAEIREFDQILYLSFFQMIQSNFLKVKQKEQSRNLSSKSVTFTLNRTGKEPSTFGEHLYEEIFANNPLVLDRKYNEKIETFNARIDKEIHQSIKSYYKQNIKKVIVPCFIYLSLVLSILFFPNVLHMLTAIGFSFLMAGALCIVSGKNVSYFTFSLCIFIPFVFGSEFGCPFMQRSLFGLTLGLIAFFSGLIRQPTKEGQRLYEHLLGLKMFLETKSSIPKESEAFLSPERMGDLFPYAMALNLEGAWVKKFKQLFGKEQLEAFTQMHLYPDRHFRTTFISALTANNNTAPPEEVCKNPPPQSEDDKNGGLKRFAADIKKIAVYIWDEMD